MARVGVLAAVFAIALFVGYRLGWLSYAHTLQHIQHLRQSQNAAVFVIGFVAIYAIGTSLGLPGLPFNVAAGALFGTVIGATLAWTASLIGAAIGYWVARTIGHDEVLRWIRRFKRIDTAVEQARDFTGMLQLRLIPVFPIGVVNFIGGLARAHFGQYVAATAIGVLPSAVIYSYFADSLLEGVGTGRRQALTSLVIASALLILLSLVPKLARRKRGAHSLRSVSAGSTADARRDGM
jgi:uncharacterized membrane protein YdjX (TVP38/TMEM64 family)